jgi:hypothetical protein
MSLGPILPRPSGTVPTVSACTARAWPSLARLGLSQHSARGPRPGPARPASDLTGAREAAGESMVGPHRRVDGGAAQARGRKRRHRVARRGVDAGVGRHDGSAVTYEDDSGEG